ncbi:MAG: glycosyltransferase family 4 protein, partial [Burkholderiaceae bacterium]
MFSSLYPSSVRPGHGIFVETRLRELLKSGRIETKVVAPVPWFFSTNVRYGQYAMMARLARREDHHGIDTLHPRYLLPPKVGMTIAPISMAIGALPAIRRLQREGFDFDLIDAHYYYPDGVAAAFLASWLRKPFVVTARGTDLNLIPAHVLPRRMMQWAASRAEASIGVSEALAKIVRNWGLPADRVLVMRNGVDLDRFVPIDPAEARRELGLNGSPILLSVGHLVELKGHHIAIEALAQLMVEHPTAKLVLIGEGPERENLQTLANRLGVAANVIFAGAIPNTQLSPWYGAADCLILASSREGWPNVLLESMACGTPVVATRIGGTPEMVSEGVSGLLVDQRDPTRFASRILELLAA